jgi:AcrR family transcriptional regulator
MSDEPREAVLRATYRALCAHGYANLTMQDIADEADLSKAALHYHYDTKRDLLTAFLDSLASWHEGRLEELSGDDAAERLRSLFDECLSTAADESDARATADADDTDDSGEADYPAFHTAMLEVKAQAPYEEAYRERLTVLDEVLCDRVRALVEAGIDEGTFRPVDPEAAATFVVDVLVGAHTRNVAVGHSLDETEAVLDAYVDDHLLAATAESPDAESDSASESDSDPGAETATRTETETEAEATR